ncbi:hypothetical protein LR48_Vigan05g090700 [Vigna angularis]|uniref:Uncharacterized protein n=1 Tax=Phaseolus angularis TaxID=3914 RepID=A0A0L9UKL5_PHAAN|nr:hypothetical protein LR48_Vigan05g090700 [Vigna angularis]
MDNPTNYGFFFLGANPNPGCYPYLELCQKSRGDEDDGVAKSRRRTGGDMAMAQRRVAFLLFSHWAQTFACGGMRNAVAEARRRHDYHATRSRRLREDVVVLVLHDSICAGSRKGSLLTVAGKGSSGHCEGYMWYDYEPVWGMYMLSDYEPLWGSYKWYGYEPVWVSYRWYGYEPVWGSYRCDFVFTDNIGKDNIDGADVADAPDA